MLVQGKSLLIRHRDDMGCERLFEAVQLRSGVCVAFIFELEHAAGRGPCDCARISIILGQSYCGVGMDQLRLVERLHLTDDHGEGEPTFVRFRDDGVGKGVSYWRLPPEEWREWIDQGLPVDQLRLAQPFDPRRLQRSLALQ